jgi:hypothetical protein
MRGTKVKKISIGGNDEDIAEIFNKMLKTDMVDMNVAYPRYLRIRGLLTSMLKVLTTLHDSRFVTNCPAMETDRADIGKFVARTTAEIEATFYLSYPDIDWNIDMLDDAAKKNFTAVYNDIKKSQLINQFIVMCSNLKPYESHIKDEKNLSASFIKKMPGVEWKPFPFISLDILRIYNMPVVGPNTLTALVAVLHKMYKFSRELYSEISSPDVNIDEFAQIIVDNLDKIRKIPALSRCQDAFKKIRESIDMLKDNFSGYYREFVVTKDSTVILQNFIIDVGSKTATSPSLTMQFQTIISYYRKNAGNQAKDPQLNAVFDKLNESLNNLSRGADNLRKKPKAPTVEIVEHEPIVATVQKLTKNPPKKTE